MKDDSPANICPICNHEPEVVARDLLRTSYCKDQHVWHTCPQHGTLVLGTYPGGYPACSCGKLVAPIHKQRVTSRDTLGDRMKRYEAVTKILLPIRSYVIVRVDGCHFHTFTKHMDKPFDPKLIEAMEAATRYACERIQGCKIGYVQSDEASFLLTDFDDISTDAWYNNQLQKVVSVAASVFTAKFNEVIGMPQLATFDARAFSLPDPVEVMNYFLWRIKDAERNSLAGLCQSLYSHRDLMNKKANEQQELLFQKGINWNDYDEKLKRGTMMTLKDSKWDVFAAPKDKLAILELVPKKTF